MRGYTIGQMPPSLELVFLPRPFPLGNAEALKQLIYSPSPPPPPPPPPLYLCQNQTKLPYMTKSYQSRLARQA
jgi:hypothetical protein